MQFLHLIALLAVVVLTTATIGADASIMKAGRRDVGYTNALAGSDREHLIERLLKSLKWDTTRKDTLDRVQMDWAKALQHKAVTAAGGEDEPMTCASCQNYMVLIIEISGDSKLLNETSAAMVAECKTQYSHDTNQQLACIATVDYVVSILPGTLKKLADKNWNVPFNLCAILFDNVCTQDCCTSNYAPEQVYISLADSNDVSQMRVTWVTLRDGLNANVIFTANGTQQVAVAERRTYTSAGWVGVINTAVMTGLTPDTTYTYSVGNDYNRSATYHFKTFPANIGTTERPLRVMSIADMTFAGRSDWTVKRVAERVLAGEVDMIIHNGDISYADGYMLHWDMFMRKVSPAFTPYVPYMTTPGNHEIDFNFTSYKNRLGMSMPTDPTALEGALYYSLNIGPTRILMMNSETPIGTADLPASQVAWAQQQLSSQDRKAQPWSLVFHHRPLYCNEDSSDCKSSAYLLRLQAESTYLNNKVDFVGSGHVHYFIRSYPLSMGAPTSTNYTNPTSPVYSINGAAGNPGANHIPAGQEALFPGQTKDVGYAIITISSDSVKGSVLNHKFYEAVGDTLVDDFTITKTN